MLTIFICRNGQFLTTLNILNLVWRTKTGAIGYCETKKVRLSVTVNFHILSPWHSAINL